MFITAGPGLLDHTPALALLDAQGKELACSAALGTSDPQFITAIRQALTDGRT